MQNYVVHEFTARGNYLIPIGHLKPNQNKTLKPQQGHSRNSLIYGQFLKKQNLIMETLQNTEH